MSEQGFSIHVECKSCSSRLELVTPPQGHDRHLHLRCRCMPEDGMLCVMLKPHQARTARA